MGIGAAATVDETGSACASLAYIFPRLSGIGTRARWSTAGIVAGMIANAHRFNQFEDDIVAQYARVALCSNDPVWDSVRSLERQMLHNTTTRLGGGWASQQDQLLRALIAFNPNNRNTTKIGYKNADYQLGQWRPYFARLLERVVSGKKS